MQKVIAVIQFSEEVSREEAMRHWREVLGPIVREVPGLRKYVQNHNAAALRGDLQFDGTAELWFDSAEAFRSATESREWQAARESAAKVFDMERLWLALADENPIL